MSSAEWDLALMGQPEEVKTRAALEYARVHRARLRLANEVLANIRNELIENEDALRQGRRRVADALENLNQVRRILNAVSALLDTVGRIINLV
jgi:hypothetical protein